MRIVALLLLCAACSSGLDAGRLRALPVGGPPVRVPLEQAGGTVGYAEVASAGPLLYTVDGERRPFVHVRLTLRNGDSRALRVPVELLVLEANGERIAPEAVFAGGEPRRSIVVGPRDVTSVDIVFPLAHAADLARLERFQVFWGVDLAGAEVRKSTAFTRPRMY